MFQLTQLGGYRKGAGAQEENLHRRTNLYACTDDPYLENPNRRWSYPLAEFGMTSHVSFKDSSHIVQEDCT